MKQHGGRAMAMHGSLFGPQNSRRVIVIAHDAGVDRKFAERYWPIFDRNAWGCLKDYLPYFRDGTLRW
jgi:hypothetical protein